MADTAARHLRDRERLPRYLFANRLLLTLSGQKPAHWMLRHTRGAAYDQLVQLAEQAPLRPKDGGGTRGPVPFVRWCDEYRPAPGVIEAFARIAAGDRVQALAFRLEQDPDDRWRCTAVDIGAGSAAPAKV